MSADRSGCLLPLLEHLLGHLALQLVCGLLPGQTSAVAHLHSVLTRALNRWFLGVGVGAHQQGRIGERNEQMLGVIDGLAKKVDKLEKKVFTIFLF